MKAINRNIIREIMKSKGRFLSIFLICAIGVGFFSGVRETGNDMKISADNFYDSHSLFDFRVLSTFGLTDSDVKAISEVEGVTAAYPSKYTDLALRFDNKEHLTRVYSIIDEDINKIILHEGRMPQAENECILNLNRLDAGYELGQTVTMADLTEAEEFPLKHTEYTIVGTFDTPMYISGTQKGSTTIGDGAIDAFMYVTRSNFTSEIYTEIYIKSDELKGYHSYSDEYELLRDRISDKLTELGISQSNLRYEEVVGEALEELADGEKELAKAKTDGEKELADAKAELEDAAQQIADGEKELEEAKAELEDGKIQLEDAEKQLSDAKAEIDKGKKELLENKSKLQEAEKEISEGRLELTNAEQELRNAKQTIDDSKTQLEVGQAELDRNKAEIEAGKQQLEEAKEQVKAAEAEYSTGLAQYEAGYAQFLEGEKQLEQAKLLYGEDNPLIQQQIVELETNRTILTETKKQLDEAKIQIDTAKAEIEANEKVLSDGEAQITAAQLEIDNGWIQYNDGLKQYDEGVSELEKGKEEFLKGYNEYVEGLTLYNDGLKAIEDGEKEYNEGVATLAEKKLEYEDGLKQYNDGISEIEEAKFKYADGLKEYEDGVKTFNTEIADAEAEIADARQKIGDLGEAEWYIFTRDDNPGYAEYESNAHRIDNIAMVFPIFFLLVAGLVCLTTMSRMVEENRTQVGTLKALGYTNGQIMKHYMVYAVSAAAAGSILGAFGGMLLFPWVIIFAYSMMYIITDISFQFTLSNILMSAGLMIAAIALTVFFSCKKVLAETPAGLMRPKAPKAGKRVFLERIGFIWNNLSFFAKVSGRNLFRYKRRMFMTVVGISGCTALMVAGFGLKDSISDIVNKQYSEIYNYSGYIAVDDKMTEEERNSLYDTLTEYDSETEITTAFLKQYTVSFDGANVQCYLTAVEDTEVFEGMVNFRERVSEKELSMSDGAIVTEKLAKLLNAKEGDTITVKISDSKTGTVKISGITEHYASHYLYLSEPLFAEIFGENPQYNMVYFSNKLSENPQDDTALSESLMKKDGVLSVILNSKSSSKFEEMLSILDLVIVVLIASAGALAFVVLYNLTNVNITERVREIATLKVLGFYDREVSSYVFRENVILSVMGSAVGLLLGVALCMFVVQTAEIDEVMFGRDIHAMSFVWSFLITVVFSLLVNLIMTKVLKKISMVESLKSVE